MKSLVGAVVLCLAILAGSSQSETLQYDDFGITRVVTLFDDIIMVELVSKDDSLVKALLAAYPAFDTSFVPIRLIGNSFKVRLVSATNVDSLLALLNSDPIVQQAARGGFDQSGEETYFTNEFQIKLADGVDVVQAVARGYLNNDADIDIVDLSYLVDYLMMGGPAPQICYKYDS